MTKPSLTDDTVLGDYRCVICGRKILNPKVLEFTCKDKSCRREFHRFSMARLRQGAYQVLGKTYKLRKIKKTKD